MKINEIYQDVITEDLEYEYKAELNPGNPISWAKTIVGYANGKCMKFMIQKSVWKKNLIKSV